VSLLDFLLRKSPAWSEVVFWSLDLETGGLKPGRDPILAVGLVPVREGTIQIGEAYTTLVRPDLEHTPDADAMGAHHLVPLEYRDAPEMAAVAPEIERRVGEGALLLHHARMDLGFLTAAFRRLGRPFPKRPVVDTVALLQKLERQEKLIGGTRREETSLNLTDARRQLGLPDYPVHDALTDAVATAELFLVLRSRLGAERLRHLT
jgi:DNA polymerase III subunit epsilon